MTNEEYRKYTERHAPRSPVGKNLIWAFLIGGLICCLGQLLMDLYLSLGLDEESAAAAEKTSLRWVAA